MHLSTISNRKTIGINFGKKDEKEKRMEWCAKQKQQRITIQDEMVIFLCLDCGIGEKKQLN